MRWSRGRCPWSEPDAPPPAQRGCLGSRRPDHRRPGGHRNSVRLSALLAGRDLAEEQGRALHGDHVVSPHPNGGVLRQRPDRQRLLDAAPQQRDRLPVYGHRHHCRGAGHHLPAHPTARPSPLARRRPELVPFPRFLPPTPVVVPVLLLRPPPPIYRPPVRLIGLLLPLHL